MLMHRISISLHQVLHRLILLLFNASQIKLWNVFIWIKWKGRTSTKSKNI